MFHIYIFIEDFHFLFISRNLYGRLHNKFCSNFDLFTIVYYMPVNILFNLIILYLGTFI